MNQPKLHISLLGGLVISLGETAVTGFASRKVEAMLVYLACNPRPHPRETLAALLWPENDQNRALANLSVALTSLRKQLETAVRAERHTVGFNTEMDFVLDTAVFQQAIIQAREVQKQRGKLSRASASQLAAAIALYRGDFLAGFNIRHAPEFEAWVLLEQERLRQMFLAALADLITFHQQRGQFNEAITYAQQLLSVDPLQENIHRQLMSLYAQDNQRPAALAQYEQCLRILNEELGVEPDEETTLFYEQIREGQSSVASLTGAEEISPPLLRPPSPLHNLPAPTTTFIGRDAELARIKVWLGEPDGRLLTIVGPGGMGKTRLAQEAARTTIGQFADGVWHVSLISHTDMNGVVTAVAGTIGLTLSGQTEPVSQLLNHLQSREMLLVLDNLEHLLTPDLLTFITQSTQQAPDLRLIATSRERLRLQAETVLDLVGLPYPDSEHYSVISNQSDTPLNTDDWSLNTDFPAVQLFVNRAQRIQSSFKLEEQAAAVTHLCQLVGGLPLALELAATWIRILSVTEIVTEIQHSLDALTTALHDVPERHRNIRAVIHSSWQMLPAAEQRLFRQLAVFRGGFTRTAAQQIADASPPQLMSLVDRSFLRRDSDQRFRRHPLLLQFAQEQLAVHPQEKAQTEATHAHFFADFVQTQEPEFYGAAAQEALTVISADFENIRAAWQWGLAQMDVGVLDQLVSGIGRFFADRSRFLEAQELFANSLKKVHARPPTAVHEQITAKIEVELGFFLYQIGRFAEAEAVLVAANKTAQRHNLTKTRIACLKHLGDVTGDQGKWDEARAHLQEALQLCRQAGNLHNHHQLPILNALGNKEVDVGNYEQAMAYFEEAMVLANALNHTLRVAILHNNIAIITNRLEKYEEAIRQYQLAYDGFKELNHEWGMAASSHNIGMVYAAMEQYDEALTYIQEAYAAHEKIGHRRGMVGGLSVLGTIYRKLGQRRQARRYYYDSLRLAQEVGVAWSAIATLVDVAELEMSYGEMERAALLLIFAIQHSAVEATTLTKAQELLAELRAELPAEVMCEAETAAAGHTLDSLIAQLIGGNLYALTTS